MLRFSNCNRNCCLLFNGTLSSILSSEKLAVSGQLHQAEPPSSPGARCFGTYVSLKGAGREKVPSSPWDKGGPPAAPGYQALHSGWQAARFKGLALSEGHWLSSTRSYERETAFYLSQASVSQFMPHCQHPLHWHIITGRYRNHWITTHKKDNFKK